MKKFTVFTVILTVLVVVVTAETFFNKYLPSAVKADITSPDSGTFTLPKTLNLNGTSTTQTTPVTQTTPATQTTPTTNFDSQAVPTAPATVTTPTTPATTDNGFEFLGLDQSTSQNSDLLGLNDPAANTTIDPTSNEPLPMISPLGIGSSDIEDILTTQPKVSTAYLEDAQIVNSGFTGAHLQAEVYDGFLFKTINISDLKGFRTEKYSVTDNTTIFAKIYVMIFDDKSTIGDTYNLLKTRAEDGQDTQLNETNDYGTGSFYMNDVRRSSVAFLTVKIGSRIYGFTYPKQYHPQIKNLISLLMLDGR